MFSLLSRATLVAGLLALPAMASEPPQYGLGKTPTPEQIRGWSIAVRPDGQGLPPGRGAVKDGDEVYANSCAACHGTFGEGVERYPRIAGEGKLTGERPEQTVGTFWPYATTLFDYINRAMPFPSPRMLSADEVYAVTAYVLNLNNIVGDDFVADKDTLPKVEMPNRNGFLWKDPRPDTHDTACMTNCRSSSEITIVSTAEGKSLTPRTTGPLDTEMPQ
jgi:mono/diheme cytochrome c family protein